MAIKRAGFISRIFARLSRSARTESGSAGDVAPAKPAPVDTPGPTPPDTTGSQSPSPAGEPAATHAEARPAAKTGDGSAQEAPATEAPATEAPAVEAPALPTAQSDEPADADMTLPASGDLPENDADIHADTHVDTQADTVPEQGTPEPSASAASEAPEPTAAPAPISRDHKVITVLSLVEHAGAATLAAALERRTDGKEWRFRTAGPGLARAAFAGMLGDTDALVLVCPPDPGMTAELGEKLRWLEANGRPDLPARTLFAINIGAAERGELQLPADLDRPVILLPFDPALSLPATVSRAPRRAARQAIDQLVHEISTIFQEH
ncbi:hypothetical protein OIU93_14340 [Paeniglutamicibacter sp. ZC-3]|uniref:hypothetical protein n=1 Tax=Paeniglutamicibacter sp. ZC-3 TaxID=2986919 RepID=UPI0021F7038F|nr:hypothetical protein [Paeniglutamicibacter sp. ZC-3]MCV9995466.1 hypothetical protein [Paeniglutamicibacter sp. ZC-3]